MRQIKICLGSSCYSRGNNVHLEVIKKYIAENHLEAEISFSGHLCEELCSSGPIPVSYTHLTLPTTPYV